MNKGLIILLAGALMVVVGATPALAEVYKVVDENGNVTYTDQEPEEGATPMTLPDISVVSTEYPEDSFSEETATDGSDESAEGKTPRELRSMYRDFQITSPGQEETISGTGNEVVISWGAGAAYEPGMSVAVFVDGESHAAGPGGNLSLTLDRGEHQVYAILRDERGRRIVTTPTVTFYVHQASVRNRPS